MLSPQPSSGGRIGSALYHKLDNQIINFKTYLLVLPEDAVRRYLSCSCIEYLTEWYTLHDRVDGSPDPMVEHVLD